MLIKENNFHIAFCNYILSYSVNMHYLEYWFSKF